MDNLSYYEVVKESLGLKERPFLDHVMSSIQDGNYFVLAPTGYGKTAISMALSMREIEDGFKIVVSYPLRSLIEQQSWKFQNFMRMRGYIDVIGVRYMGRADSPYLVHPVTLTTVDNLSSCPWVYLPRIPRKYTRNIMGRPMAPWDITCSHGPQFSPRLTSSMRYIFWRIGLSRFPSL